MGSGIAHRDLRIVLLDAQDYRRYNFSLHYYCLCRRLLLYHPVPSPIFVPDYTQLFNKLSGPGMRVTVVGLADDIVCASGIIPECL